MSVRRWWLPMLISIGFVLALIVISPSWVLYSDSYRYAKQAEKVLGVPAETAHLDALTAWCRTKTDKEIADGLARHALGESQAAHSWQVNYAECWDRSVAKGDVTTLDPRYQSIFTTRVGYPLLLAPFVAAFGIVTGMRVLGVLLALLGGLLAYGIGRTLGLGQPAAAVAQLTYLVSPLGWWAMQGVTEGLVDACVMAAVWGLLLMIGARIRRSRPTPPASPPTADPLLVDPKASQGEALGATATEPIAGAGPPPAGSTSGHRPVTGAILLAASWIVLGLARFSTLLMAATALAVAAALLAAFIPRARHRWTGLAIGINALAAVMVVVVSAVAGLPGASVTLQDTFTDHFALPLVPDPWQRLVQLDGTFWRGWLSDQLHAPAFVLLIALAFTVMIRWAPELAWISGGVFAVGVASIAAHPLVNEAPRLGVLMWVPVVLGLSVLAEVAIGATVKRFQRSRPAPDAVPAVPA